jgi:hypothetical protein
MKRILYIKGGRVQNVVGYEDDAEVPPYDEGCFCVVDPTNTINAGDAYDMREITLDRADVLMLKELLRLTNAVRALKVPPEPALSGSEYRAFLKTRL